MNELVSYKAKWYENPKQECLDEFSLNFNSDYNFSSD